MASSGDLFLPENQWEDITQEEKESIHKSFLGAKKGTSRDGLFEEAKDGIDEILVTELKTRIQAQKAIQERTEAFCQKLILGLIRGSDKSMFARIVDELLSEKPKRTKNLFKEGIQPISFSCFN